jgi:hypothetical protein
MEIWQIIAAIYLSGVCAAMYSIWWPSYKLVRQLAPNNIMVDRPILSTLIVFFIFLLCFPLLIITFIVPNRLEGFIRGFVTGIIEIK